MPSTERLYAASDEAAHQLACIAKARKTAYRQIERIAHELMAETGCSAADANRFLDYADEGLGEALHAVITLWKGEGNDADETIGNIEERDLRLSSPVVL